MTQFIDHQFISLGPKINKQTNTHAWIIFGQVTQQQESFFLFFL